LAHSLPSGRRFHVSEDAVYAVVKTGGKQYRVEEGRAIKVERLSGEPGDTVELGEVLLMGEGADVTVGAPFIEGARVIGTIAEQGRSKKIVVFRYKAKTRQRKKTGHRQHFTRLLVSDILAKGQDPKPRAERAAPAAAAEAPAAETPAAPKPKSRRAKPGTTEALREIYAEAQAEAEAAAEKPKRGRRKAADDAPQASEEKPKDEKPKRSRKKTEE
jgi:large subunit ribosomal protein L21